MMRMKLRNEKAFKCKECGRVTYPSRAVCLGCGSREFEEIPFTEKCTLVTHSQIYTLPWGIDRRYLTIGICEFDNGVKAMGRVSTPDVEDGMRMKASWENFREMDGEEVWGWVFRPDD